MMKRNSNKPNRIARSLIEGELASATGGHFNAGSGDFAEISSFTIIGGSTLHLSLTGSANVGLAGFVA